MNEHLGTLKIIYYFLQGSFAQGCGRLSIFLLKALIWCCWMTGNNTEHQKQFCQNMEPQCKLNSSVNIMEHQKQFCQNHGALEIVLSISWSTRNSSINVKEQQKQFYQYHGAREIVLSISWSTRKVVAKTWSSRNSSVKIMEHQKLVLSKHGALVQVKQFCQYHGAPKIVPFNSIEHKKSCETSES